jgi:hypothetical protein
MLESVVEDRKSEEEVNGVREDVQKIRYMSDEIKVVKRSGKRTASALCAFGMSKQRPARSLVLLRSESLQSTSSTMPSASPPSSVLQVKANPSQEKSIKTLGFKKDSYQIVSFKLT